MIESQGNLRAGFSTLVTLDSVPYNIRQMKSMVFIIAALMVVGFPCAGRVGTIGSIVFTTDVSNASEFYRVRLR